MIKLFPFKLDLICRRVKEFASELRKTDLFHFFFYRISFGRVKETVEPTYGQNNPYIFLNEINSFFCFFCRCEKLKVKPMPLRWAI